MSQMQYSDCQEERSATLQSRRTASRSVACSSPGFRSLAQTGGSIHFVGRTSRAGSVETGNSGLVRHLQACICPGAQQQLRCAARPSCARRPDIEYWERQSACVAATGEASASLATATSSSSVTAVRRYRSRNMADFLRCIFPQPSAIVQFTGGRLMTVLAWRVFSAGYFAETAACFALSFFISATCVA